MGLSRYPSHFTLPHLERPYPSILDVLAARFPAVRREVWEQRIAEGKVLDGASRPITGATAYVPGGRIHYFREVGMEPVIPFTETILHRDDEILVACKPHFLPVTPGGRYVDECLLNRLRTSTGIRELAPLHRIDRETAGLVMFSVNRKTRGLYGELFRAGRLEKTYEARATCPHPPERDTWLVEDRIVPGEPWFRMKSVPGVVNARSMVRLVSVEHNRALFRLQPLTGKTHQLRIHLSSLGFGILNDRFYPVLQPESADDFDRPLQLVARMVRFRDPVTGRVREFESRRELMA